MSRESWAMLLLEGSLIGLSIGLILGLLVVATR